MNTDKLKSCALLNKRLVRGLSMAALESCETTRPSPRIFAITFGTLLSIVPASNVIAENLQKIGTVVISGLTQQPTPVFSAGVEYSITPATGGGGGGTSRSRFTPFTLTKKVDASSPKLLLDIASGRRIQQVSIDIFVPTGKTILTNYELSNVIPIGSTVRSVQDGNKTVLIEDITFDYEKIKQIVFSTSGPVEECWDRSQNSSC
jgi:type VI secretion system Hcp family effector